jgi:hypothetical protein
MTNIIQYVLQGLLAALAASLVYYLIAKYTPSLSNYASWIALGTGAIVGIGSSGFVTTHITPLVDKLFH